MKSVIHVLALSLLLAACSKDEPKAPPLLPGTGSPVASVDAPAVPLPPGDPSKPLSEYPVIDNGRIFLALQHLYRPGGPKLEELATNLSEDYAREQDAFKRQDKLKAIQPDIELLLQKARDQKHMAMDLDAGPGQVKSFDFQQRAFVLASMEDHNAQHYFSDHRWATVSFHNSQDFRLLDVTEEALAREIESMRPTGRMKLRVYFHVGDMDALSNTLRARVMAVSLLAPDGKVLATHQGS